jgi:tRNA U34 5-methylaminomethyl-2-thiouridine-forming methyltransferase MnmC
MKMKIIENNYDLIKTGDGSYSLFSYLFQELMHTESGAYEEALLKHVIPSKILESKKSEVTILDIGFGLGYNVLAVLNEFCSINKKPFINIISLEIDPSISFWMNKIRFNDRRDFIYDSIKNALTNGNYYNGDWYSFRVIFGDARIACRQLVGKSIILDAVFHDAFSPGKNPELWSLDFFKNIHSLLSFDGILTTYSSALQIRNALAKAGFNIGRGPTTGKKRESTIASKGKAIHCFEKSYIDALSKEIKATVYCDENMNLSRNEILKRRIDEMKLLRDNRQVHPE